MSSLPMPTDHSNVRSMESFLEGLLQRIDHWDNVVAAARVDIVAQLRALRAAGQPDVATALAQYEAQLRDGALPELDDPLLLEKKLIAWADA